MLTLVLRGDVDILYNRYLNRMQKENRHPVHLSTTLDIFEDFKKCAEYLRTVKTAGNMISIDINDFTYQTDEDILAPIDEFMRD